LKDSQVEGLELGLCWRRGKEGRAKGGCRSDGLGQISEWGEHKCQTKIL
jgi:hypothetical protein